LPNTEFYGKSITKIYTAQVDCVTTFNKAVDYLTNIKIAWLQPIPFLKPNCLLSVERNSLENLHVMAYSCTVKVTSSSAMAERPQKHAHNWIFGQAYN